MTIKYAARGISTQMRTAEELLFTDGVTLKPVNGGDVLVDDVNNSTIILGTDYNASTGGCTINGVVYESEADLIDIDFYVITSAFSAYNLMTDEIVGVGYHGMDYLTPAYYWGGLPDMVTDSGYYRTDTVPMQTPVWKISDSTVGTRYTGSLGDAAVKDANGNFYYYDSVAECDAVWTTEELFLAAYSTAGSLAYQQSHDQSQSSGTTRPVFSPGSSSGELGDYAKYHDIISIKNRSGLALSAEKWQLLTSSGDLKLRNLSENIQAWCRIEYRAVDEIYAFSKSDGGLSNAVVTSSNRRYVYDKRKGNFWTDGSDKVSYTIAKAWLADGTEITVPSGVYMRPANTNAEGLLYINNNSTGSFTFCKLLLRAQAVTQ